MCGIFGFINYKRSQPVALLNDLCNSLAQESEVRGSHATGISYIHNGKVKIYKEPKPASSLDFKIPFGTVSLMGHTRHATQGDYKVNQNNHPFRGRVKNNEFAFSHNGIIYNDKLLRKNLNLPQTPIETDSYIGVQLLESQNELSLQSMKYISEQIEGCFVFTALSQHNDLYIAKNDNPVSIIHFKDIGLFVYASTEKILFNALMNTSLFKNIKKDLTVSKTRNIDLVELVDGEIIKITSTGRMKTTKFHIKENYTQLNYMNFRVPYQNKTYRYNYNEKTYLDELTQIAGMMGLCPDDVMLLYEMGIDLLQIEDLIYDQDAFQNHVDLIKEELGFCYEDESIINI